MHHFWHTLDLAVTRFSGRRAPLPADADRVTRRGLLPRGHQRRVLVRRRRIPEPAFYSYTTPEPAGLTDEPLYPEQARWIDSRGAHLALLRYEDARITPDPRATVLQFFESAYLAGATRAGWDIEAMRVEEA